MHPGLPRNLPLNPLFALAGQVGHRGTTLTLTLILPSPLTNPLVAPAG